MVNSENIDWEKVKQCQIVMVLDRQCLYQDMWDTYHFELKYGTILILFFSFLHNLQQQGQVVVDRNYKIKLAALILMEFADYAIDIYFMLATEYMA